MSKHYGKKKKKNHPNGYKYNYWNHIRNVNIVNVTNRNCDKLIK